MVELARFSHQAQPMHLLLIKLGQHISGAKQCLTSTERIQGKSTRAPAECLKILDKTETAGKLKRVVKCFGDQTLFSPQNTLDTFYFPLCQLYQQSMMVDS